MLDRYIMPLAFSAALLCTANAHAQEFAFRAGLGPAVGGEAGGAAILAGELATRGIVVRGEAGAVGIGASGEWVGTARTITVGGAVGLVDRRATSALRPYGLARIATGLDPREADRATLFGGSLGVETRRRGVGVFGELRYDYWKQRGIRYFDLPANVFGAVVGVVIH